MEFDEHELDDLIEDEFEMLDTLVDELLDDAQPDGQFRKFSLPARFTV